MIKSLVNKFIKTFQKKSFEDSVATLICFQIKKRYSDTNSNKTLLPVAYASSMGITVTMSTKIAPIREPHMEEHLFDTL